MELNSPDCQSPPLAVRLESRGLDFTTQRHPERMMPNDALKAVLDGLLLPTILVTGRSRIVFLNTAAHQVIRDRDGLTAERDELRATSETETRILHAVIRDNACASTTGGPAWSDLLSISKHSPRRSIDILVTPFFWHSQVQYHMQSSLAAVFVLEPRTPTEISDSALVEVCGLTRSEARVVLAVCRGLSGKEICRELNISYNTLKTHLKHIYLKTQTRHKAELVGAISARLCNVLDRNERAVAQFSRRAIQSYTDTR